MADPNRRAPRRQHPQQEQQHITSPQHPPTPQRISPPQQPPPQQQRISPPQPQSHHATPYPQQQQAQQGYMPQYAYGYQPQPNYGMMYQPYRPQSSEAPSPTPPYIYSTYPPPPSTQHYASTSPIYTHSAPGYTYGHPQQVYSPAGEEAQGTWWYVPPQPQHGHGVYPAGGVSPGGYVQQQRTTPPEGQYAYNNDYTQHATLGEHTTGSSSSSTSARRIHGQRDQREQLPTSPPPPPPQSPQTPQRPVVRKSYHPNPPPARSEWVMWAGNVPGDIKQEELWRFFSDNETSSGEGANVAGVLSIHLISRSSCAFVNYASKEQLESAIERFNGVSVREGAQGLVCRVRRRDDDLKAGVGGQRGMGMHRGWVKDFLSSTSKKGKAKVEPPTSLASSSVPSSSSSHPSSAHSPSEEEDEDLQQRKTYKRGDSNSSGGSGISGISGSTNSSLLRKYFPKRYFILKSLSPDDLDTSVGNSMWATQRHNEGILDQAYRTSEDVYLIFGVNKSGEFYGYARMSGPILRSDRRIAWASRTDSSPSSKASISPITGRGPLSAETIAEEPPASPTTVLQRHSQPPPPSLPATSKSFISPSEGVRRFVDDSPQPLSNVNTPAYEMHGPVRQKIVSAPPSFGPLAKRLTGGSAAGQLQNRSLEMGKTDRVIMALYAEQLKEREQEEDEEFELDETAPIKAMHISIEEKRSLLNSVQETSKETLEERETQRETMVSAPPTAPSPHANDAPVHVEENGESWGESFPIQWISTEKLPFYRTRHLRNPWNHDREVKVSRDGTELEPTVGQALIEEWDRLAEAGPSVSPVVGTGGKKNNHKLGARHPT